MMKPLCTLELLTQPADIESNVYISATDIDLPVKQTNKSLQFPSYTSSFLLFKKGAASKLLQY